MAENQNVQWSKLPVVYLASKRPLNSTPSRHKSSRRDFLSGVEAVDAERLRYNRGSHLCLHAQLLRCYLTFNLSTQVTGTTPCAHQH